MNAANIPDQKCSLDFRFKAFLRATRQVVLKPVLFGKA